MGAIKLQYLTDEEGKKVSVLLPLEKYIELLEAFEELEDIKAFDEYKKNKEETIPLREAIKLRNKNNTPKKSTN